MLIVNGGFSSYEWFDGIIGNILSVNIFGDVEVMVMDVNGCEGIVFVIVLEISLFDL